MKKGNKEKSKRGLGIAGFVLGLVSLFFVFLGFFNFILIILSVVFSIMQLRRSFSGIAIAGLIMSVISSIITLIFIFIVAFSILSILDIFSGEINSADKIRQSIVYVRHNVAYLDSLGKVQNDEISGSGVIVRNDSFLEIYTNRHVVDCVYDLECNQVINESFEVITFDGKKHEVTKIFYAPGGMDIAILKVNSTNYPKASIGKEVNEGDRVVAAGYPGFSVRVVEISTASGVITGFRNLMTSEGFSFEVIESNAYTSFGSSGGGLFDEYGNLIGITTWGDENSGCAINFAEIDDLELFSSCEKGEYFKDKKCLKYCSGFYNKDYACIEPCSDFYCESELITAQDSKCGNSGMVFGDDGYCHNSCGSKNNYCPAENSYCYKNNCVSCPTNYVLYKNGLCFFSFSFYDYNPLLGRAILNAEDVDWIKPTFG